MENWKQHKTIEITADSNTNQTVMHISSMYLNTKYFMYICYTDSI